MATWIIYIYVFMYVYMRILYTLSSAMESIDLFGFSIKNEINLNRL